MFCNKCGQPLNGAAFCQFCGTPSGIAPGGAAAAAGGMSPTIQINNLNNNDNLKKVDELGCFEVLEHQRDLSVDPMSAMTAYYMSQMNFRKRQVLCKLNGNAVKVQAGAMQWTAGNVMMSSGVKGAKDFFGKALKGMATNESAVKPIYNGNGYLMLEPTFRYIILEDLSKWGSGMVLDDGMFLACDANVQEEVVRRTNLSSALAGGEGLFNLSLSGNGVAVLESSVPREELIEFVLNNDEVRIDGNMAVAWSKSLQFTVEKSTKSFLGSLASGEGLVNVFRGTGRILMAPIGAGTHMKQNNAPKEAAKTSSSGIIGSVVSSVLDM